MTHKEIAAATSPSVPITQPFGRPSCSPVLQTGVGGVLHGVIVTESDVELEESIVYCAQRCQHYHERYELIGDPADREKAVEWDRRRAGAMSERRGAIKRALEHDLMLRIDDGAGFFASAAAQALGRPSAAGGNDA